MWNKKDSFNIPGRLLPSFRTSLAIQEKIEKNILIKTWGGIGDQICAEPTLRYALETFKNGEKITLASEIPELFSHLKFNDVFDLKKETPIWDDYLVVDTIVNADVYNVVSQFMSHSITNCVDFPSLCAFRCTLPIKSKEVTMWPPEPESRELFDLGWDPKFLVYVHAGKHWPSKTFPKDWWDRALKSIIAAGLKPVLIGKEIEEHQGTVDTMTEGCIDLRNKTTLSETIWLLKNARVLVCNDSSPLHMAVSGSAWIGFIATAKHPDYIMHWRKGQWAWRMQNLGLGGIWEMMDNCPNRLEDTKIDNIDADTLRSWLPEPETIGTWCAGKLNDFTKI
jgi:hypothetical protein